MRRVFNAGERLGRGRDPWLHRPPVSDQLGPWIIDFFDRLDQEPRPAAGASSSNLSEERRR
jgi:hypothetical protein